MLSRNDDDQVLIFGRSPNLVLGAGTAIFNTVVVFHIGGFDPTPDQVAVVNVMFGAIIALISNTSSVAIAAGRAAVARKNGNGKP